MTYDDRRSFDTAASGETQSNFNTIAQQLEGLIAQRNSDVAAAMSDYQADGSSEEYAAKELRWRTVADEVTAIINTLRGALESNDSTAQTAMQRASTAVANIG